MRIHFRHGICLLLLLISGSLSWAVTLVGQDTTTDKDWRRPATVKPNDLDHNNVYGTDGFVLFEWQRANFAWGTRAAANDLAWLPSYIDSITTNTFANAYRNDTNYGLVADPNTPYVNHAGTVLSGENSWASNVMDKIVLKRRGTTRAFGLTVFSNYYDAAVNSQLQVWVHTGTDAPSAVQGIINYAANKTVYVTFNIPAGSEDITLRFYSQANHISGLAFDGYEPRPFLGTGIAAVGTDSSTNAAWLVPSGAATKPNDADGNNVYGTDGFYLFERTLNNFQWATRDRSRDLAWLPAYINSISTDTFQNSYRNDSTYGVLTDVSAPYQNYPGTVVSGQNSWVSGIMDQIVVKRNGATGPFWVTVFSTYYDATRDTNLQIWAHLGSASANPVNCPITYAPNATGYSTFYVPAGSEDITLRFYSQANHVTGLAFDGLQARPYSGPAVVCLGNDAKTNAAWRTSSVAKVNDADEVYGTDGFAMFEWNRGNWVWGSRATPNDIRWLPSYINTVTDDFANGYRNDTAYGSLDVPGMPGIVRQASVASGKLWDFNNVIISRNGNTGPFNLTVFSSYFDDTKSSDTQIWVHTGSAASSAVRGDLMNDNQKTRYVTFQIAGGTEDITIRAYGNATHLSGVAFDGLAPRPYATVTSLMHYDAEGSVSGDVHYTSGTVTVSAPTLSTVHAYEGASSFKVDFNTGDLDGVYGVVKVYPTWKQLPLNMDTLKFASYAPAGLVFHVSVEDDNWPAHAAPWWGMHHTPDLTQTTHNGWQVNEIKLSDLTEPIDPATLNANMGTIFVYFHGAGWSGQSGLSGSAFFDAFQFVATPPLITGTRNWDLYQ